MIKVLKHGKVDKLIATCPSCGCVFSFQEMDKKEVVVTHRSDFSPARYEKVVDCPDCGMKVRNWRRMEESEKTQVAVSPAAAHSEPVCGY